MGVMTGPLILNDHPGQYVEIDRKPDGTLFVQEDYRAATRGYVDSKTYSAAGNLFVSTKGNDDMWDFDNNRPNPLYGYPEEEIRRGLKDAIKEFLTEHIEWKVKKHFTHQNGLTILERV
jgi:hypothetical protein